MALFLVTGMISLNQACSPFGSQEGFQAQSQGTKSQAFGIESYNQSDQATNGGGTVVGNPFGANVVLKRDRDLVTQVKLRICVAEIYFSDKKLIEDSPTNVDSIGEIYESSMEWITQLIQESIAGVFNSDLTVSQPITSVGEMTFQRGKTYQQINMRADEKCSGYSDSDDHGSYHYDSDEAPAVSVQNSHGYFELKDETIFTFNTAKDFDYIGEDTGHVVLILDSIYPELENVSSEKELARVIKRFRGEWVTRSH